MRTRVLARWLATLSFLFSVAAVAGQDGSRLETLDQLTRLQIPVTSGSTFRMLSGKSGAVTLVVDRVATAGLANLEALSDSRVQKVTVKPVGLDKAEIEVRFQEAATESFAYQQGNVLVLDLWKGSAPKAETPKALAKALPKAVKPAPTAKAARIPASAHVAVPSASIVAPLRTDKDLFQKFLFPMPELTVSAPKDGGLALPLKFELDERWKFSKGDQSTDDGKSFELAKSLYNSKKYGLSLKAIEIVLRDFPKTPHAPELFFLRALAYKKLGQATQAGFLVDKSDKMLEELAARRDEAGQPFPFNRLIILSFAQKELEAQNWLQAIQHLEYVSSVTPQKDPEFPYVQMLLAESYSKVNQPRRAERVYRFLAEKFPKHPLAKEAFYRIADLLAIEKNYVRVADEGRAAIETYPDYEKTRSEVLFHVAEAYFWMGNYAQAEKYFRRYTEIASAQTNASLAWVRLGEIEEIFHSNTQAAHADYLKAKNGYPFSRGDLVATVRMARLDLPTEKEPSFVVKTLREMLEDKTTDWDLRRMAELTLADYLLLTGDTERAIAIANSGMAQTDGNVYELYKRTYEKALFTKLSKLTKDKRYADALALYGREKKWIEQYGAESFRVASEIYRGLGLFSTANKLMEQYSTELAKGRIPASLVTQEKMSRDKASNSFARGSYTETIEQLGNQGDAQSNYLRAVSHFRLRHKAEAYLAAEKALGLAKEAKEKFTDDMVENLAEILMERDDVERDYPRMSRDIAACRAMLAKDNERLSFAAADSLWYQKRHKDAANAYREALEKFPTGLRAERGRYNMGMSLVGMGHRDEAVKLLTELQNSGQSIWAESAKQEIQLIEWEKKYSSVLRTLPPSGLGIAQ